MTNNVHNDQILDMLALSEEINSINHKVKQLVEDLHNTQNVLAGIKDLTQALNSKVGSLNSKVEIYKPRVEESDGKSSNPSYVDGMNERVRIVPTPENYQEYLDNPAVATVPITATVREPLPVPVTKTENPIPNTTVHEVPSRRETFKTKADASNSGPKNKLVKPNKKRGKVRKPAEEKKSFWKKSNAKRK